MIHCLFEYWRQRRALRRMMRGVRIQRSRTVYNGTVMRGINSGGMTLRISR